MEENNETAADFGPIATNLVQEAEEDDCDHGADSDTEDLPNAEEIIPNPPRHR
jgi:hypothetical protein